MPKQTRAKQERVIEIVRHGLEGEAAVDFIHQCGFAITGASVSRCLKKLGGRERIQQLIEEGKSNLEVLQACVPDAPLNDMPRDEPHHGEHVENAENELSAPPIDDHPLYETTKISLKIPADLYEAIRFAAKAEHKTQSQLIVDILTEALSNIPEQLE
jgi:hypothetical protein